MPKSKRGKTLKLIIILTNQHSDTLVRRVILKQIFAASKITRPLLYILIYNSEFQSYLRFNALKTTKRNKNFFKIIWQTICNVSFQEKLMDLDGGNPLEVIFHLSQLSSTLIHKINYTFAEPWMRKLWVISCFQVS